MTYSRRDWYEDPSEAQELGKNWCVSVLYHELWLMEDTKKVKPKHQTANQQHNT